MVKRNIKRTDSKSSVRGFVWNKTVGTVFPDFSFSEVMRLVESDPTAKGAITHFVDKCMEGDYAVVKRDTLQYDRQFELKLDEEYKFRNDVLRKTFLLGKLFQNVYLEIISNTDGSVKAVNTLDTMNVEPITKSNGDPIKYRSAIPDPTTGTYPVWEEKEIVWIKFNDRGVGFAPVDMKALYHNLYTKSFVKEYVAWLWQTGQYRLIYNFTNASDKDIDDFLVYARKHDNNFRSPFLVKGEMKSQLLRDMREQESLVSFLKYLDAQTLILLRIPPIDAGIPDASGRSNADAQSNNLSSHITSYKKVVEDSINYVLFPRMNKGNSLLRFGPNDRFEEKQVWDIVNLQKNMGMSVEAIREYLCDRGMFFETKDLFVDPVKLAQDMAQAVPQQGTPGMKKDINSMPSRAKGDSGPGRQDKNSQTTRPDQVSSR